MSQNSITDIENRQDTADPGVEYLDVVDVQGRPTGIIKSRRQVHREGDWHKTVHVWLVNKNHELLLQLRAAGKESFPGYWDISCAGHRRAGETAIQAALHEVYEELGIALAPESLKNLFAVKNAAVLNGGTFIDNEIADVFLVHFDAPAKSFPIGSSEVAQVRWFSIARIKNCIKDNALPIVPHSEEYERLFSFFDKHLIQTA